MFPSAGNTGTRQPTSPLQLCSNFLELGCQTFTHRLPPYREVARLVVGPTEVGETQKVKGLRLSFSALFPALSGEAPELDQARLLRMQFQPELPQAFPEFVQETFCFGPLLEPQHGYKIYTPIYPANPTAFASSAAEAASVGEH